VVGVGFGVGIGVALSVAVAIAVCVGVAKLANLQAPRPSVPVMSVPKAGLIRLANVLGFSFSELFFLAVIGAKALE